MSKEEREMTIRSGRESECRESDVILRWLPVIEKWSWSTAASVVMSCTFPVNFIKKCLLSLIESGEGKTKKKY
jgi:hypothetical protein